MDPDRRVTLSLLDGGSDGGAVAASGMAPDRRIILSLLGGGWNAGNDTGFHPVCRAAFGLRVGSRGLLEAALSVRTRPRVWCSPRIVDGPACRDRVAIRGTSLSAHILVGDAGADSQPYIGLGLTDGTLIAHGGALVDLQPRFGLRLEAAGYGVGVGSGRLGFTACELLAGGYFLP